MHAAIPRDTTPQAIRIQHQALHKLGIAGRAAMTFQLGENLRRISESGIRLHHPDYDDEQVRAATARRMLGRELSKHLSTDLGQGPSMSQQEFFGKVISALQSSQIPFMVCGSLASSLHGDPRATRDADMVIRPTGKTLEQFLDQIGRDFYVSSEAARQAMQQHSMFNVIDAASGWKVDLIIAPESAFADESFSRRMLADFMGVKVAVQTPEDTILSKLDWAKESGSEMQLRDALGVALQQWQQLDQDYLRRWAAELGPRARVRDTSLMPPDA